MISFTEYDGMSLGELQNKAEAGDYYTQEKYHILTKKKTVPMKPIQSMAFFLQGLRKILTVILGHMLDMQKILPRKISEN